MDNLAQGNGEAIDADTLSRATGGNHTLMREVLDLFASHLPVPLAHLRTDASPGDWKYATHTIKGAARAVGAKALADAAAAAERSSPDARSSHVAAVLREVEAAQEFVIRFNSRAN